jgi:hypothetical protein
LKLIGTPACLVEAGRSSCGGLSGLLKRIRFRRVIIFDGRIRLRPSIGVVLLFRCAPRLSDWTPAEKVAALAVPEIGVKVTQAGMRHKLPQWQIGWIRFSVHYPSL